jgi:hypothetical protein
MNTLSSPNLESLRQAIQNFTPKPMWDFGGSELFAQIRSGRQLRPA